MSSSLCRGQTNLRLQRHNIDCISSAAAPQLRPLQLHCCSQFVSTSTAAWELSAHQLLFPDRVATAPQFCSIQLMLPDRIHFISASVGCTEVQRSRVTAIDDNFSPYSILSMVLPPNHPTSITHRHTHNTAGLSRIAIAYP